MAAANGASAEKLTFYCSAQEAWSQLMAISQAENANNKTIGNDPVALGFGYNSILLVANDLPTPARWADLLRPEFKGHIQMSNPNSSGTADTTMVHLFGEDQGFKFMSELYASIKQYTKSGCAPVKAAGRGQNTIGIVFYMTFWRKR